MAKAFLTSTGWEALSTILKFFVWPGIESDILPSRSECATTEPNLLGLVHRSKKNILFCILHPIDINPLESKYLWVPHLQIYQKLHPSNFKILRLWTLVPGLIKTMPLQINLGIGWIEIEDLWTGVSILLTGYNLIHF